MVDRAEQQGGVEGGVLERQIPGVAELGPEGAVAASGVDLGCDRVDQVNVVPVLGECGGMDAGGATDVEDPRAGRHQLADQLLGALVLEPALGRSRGEPYGFLELPAVVGPEPGVDGVLVRIGHAFAALHAPRGRSWSSRWMT